MSEREGEPMREAVMETLKRLSDKYPHLRICQLIQNAAVGRHSADLYYIEDSQLLGWLMAYEYRVDRKL